MSLKVAFLLITLSVFSLKLDALSCYLCDSRETCKNPLTMTCGSRVKYCGTMSMQKEPYGTKVCLEKEDG